MNITQQDVNGLATLRRLRGLRCDFIVASLNGSGSSLNNFISTSNSAGSKMLLLVLTEGHCYLMALETTRGATASTEEGGRGGA